MSTASSDLLRRTHHCGAIRLDDAAREVILTGWVARVRDHGSLVFVDLRDRTGVVQLVVDEPALMEQAKRLRNEFVVGARGTVRARDASLINPKLPTGEVEVALTGLTVHNPSRTPPFAIEDDIDTEESLRLRYRYLDLRRPEMHRAMVLRHRAIKSVRDFFYSHDFVEVETPVLTRSTPEGARDYLVPSRIQPGHFFALPQSPQLFKQLMMVAGLERYLQIVRCFRDEDLRADRQPEFTQIDVEMSFVEEEDVMGLVEGMMVHVYREVLGVELAVPFPRLTYDAAMARFGSDRPDLRIPMKITDLSALLVQTEFKVFRKVLAGGGVVRALKVPGGGTFSRKELDD
ncbi:MAG: aspartate--tRNA ligase, partial [Thermaerobacterales bacterium]